MLRVPKASSRARTYTGIRRFMQERSLSGAAHVPSPLAKEPAFWLRREPTWERSPMCVPSARDATASHPPTTTTTSELTRELPLDVSPLTRSFLDIRYVSMSASVHISIVLLYLEFAL